MPTAQMKAVGIWGIVAILAIGISGQIPGFPIDWAAPIIKLPFVEQMPLGGWLIAGAMAVGGWWKGGDKSPPKAKAK